MLNLNFKRRQGAFLIDVEVPLDARVTALFGPSGAGKTSILNCVAGLARPDAGSIVLDGRTLWSAQERINLPPEQRRIGYVFQDARLFPHLSVRANLQYGMRARGLRGTAERERTVVELLGLESLLARSPSTLSGGEQQRVAIGRAVLADPQLLLLDEPLASLDLARRLDVLKYMTRLRSALDIAMLYVSHDTEEVLMLADEVVCLDQGRMTSRGPPSTVLAVSELSWALEARQESSILQTTVAEQKTATGLTLLSHPAGLLKVPGLQLERGWPVNLRVQAADVILSKVIPEGLSVRNTLPGTVIEIRGLGESQVRVGLMLGPDRVESIITREAAESLELGPGHPIYALIKASVVETAGPASRSTRLAPRAQAD